MSKSRILFETVWECMIRNSICLAYDQNRPMYDVLRGYMFKELRKKTTAKDSKLVRKVMITCGVTVDILMMMMTTRTKVVLLLALDRSSDFTN